MDIKKGLSFADAIYNFRRKKKAAISIIMSGIISFFVLVYLGENHIISEKGAVVMGQGLFLGFVVSLWNIVSGKMK